MTAEAVAARTAVREVTLSPAARELRRELDLRWPAGGDRMHEIARYALLAPGKLLRPLLLVASAEATGGSRSEVVPAALAVEYLHVASLIHDDVIDGDDLRRGQSSVHALYGVPDAIATGDALLFRVFSAVAECVALGVPDTAVLAAVRVLAEAGEDLCRGQVQEAELAAAWPGAGGLEAYREMASLKTGALLRAACRAGALLSGGSPEETEAVTVFAGHLGLAFQMYDDLLPYLADPAVTGKPGTSDAANLRPTFPVLLAHEAAGPEDRHRLEQALGGDFTPERTFAVLREVLLATGALDLARDRAYAEIARARAALAPLPSGDAHGLLSAIADLTVHRDR
ncbi:MULTISPECIES: polyprenyl synthetase family protein [Streptomyces]|jgi:geranylgeranyl diphosphate synthase type I|uniref:Polyprenyl synthetase family protein n=1 Tax=Streptomyces griseoaurantiacus TaxID=68213 RepID=A0A7W2DXY2_9ACTN|nr:MULTISPECIES: polyprenyl synthetase family protein [Streptomyces]MBA5224952.1 polyprenyl synthetase family protein [Streptomyces griseoaurantiacus]MDX3088618.1 polyprenyl synthetase family protein [Streptomyces sp. ME12-02E]MDX3331866.1 polyprenyl synthetase family protein [Streptomyces sp. ME02-6978a]MDX3358514.1 polyprenyl synthetase family protein [Streptomyces sp. ME02-6978.2a]GHE56385.1 serralysin [Streptomyces griseoaurantiacus]